jgi:uncharacterized phiE125 gp8 family phage protein
VALRVVTPPEVEPVSLEDAKLHCRVDGNAEDELLKAAIQSAREHVEEEAVCRALITQTLCLYLDAFPCGVIEVPRPPVQRVTSVKYFDGAGNEQTLDPELYQVDLVSCPPRLIPAYGYSWPTTQPRLNAVAIEYVAGYGGSPADVPARIRQGMLLDVQDAYDNRGTLIVGTVSSQLARTAAALYRPFRVRGVRT